MKAVGIIAEYNPLHNGHIYHIEESKKLAGTDAVVVAMSGNFCQHGEPAILDKWERSKLAVLNGADVVFEIPALFCLGNSLQYATAGVKLLESLGCVTHLSFGSECGDAGLLKTVADNLTSNERELSDLISTYSKSEGVSYPRAREMAYSKLCGEKNIEVLSNSNDNLAVSYLQVVSNLKPIAVKREGAGYDESMNADYTFQSATGIRQALISGDNIEGYVPANVLNSLKTCITTNPDKWLSCLKYAVLTMSAEDIDKCPSGGEGLGNKIKNEIQSAKSWNELIKNVKSKRYTYSRISRLCMQIILGISRETFNNTGVGYIRILALSKKGRELISYSEKNELNSLPIITNVNKQRENISSEYDEELALDIHAGDIYNLVTGRDQEMCSDYRTIPLIQ